MCSFESLATSPGPAALAARTFALCHARAFSSLAQNRINRLIIEQDKAEKRIAETQRRTEEIHTLKARNMANAEARRDASAWLSAEQELQKELLKENKAQRAAAIQSSRHAIMALRQDEVKVLKQMREENEAAAAQHRDMERQRNNER